MGGFGGGGSGSCYGGGGGGGYSGGDAGVSGGGGGSFLSTALYHGTYAYAGAAPNGPGVIYITELSGGMPTPEPATIGVLGAGLMMLGLARRRQRHLGG